MPKTSTSDDSASAASGGLPREQQLAAEPSNGELEQLAVSADLMSALQLVEAKFYEAPVTVRRLLLLDWLTLLRNRLGPFQCIGELVDAFIELERGLRPPLFRPVETVGRPPLPMIVEDLQSAAALAMDAVMLSQKRKQEAARIVARRLGYSVSDPSGWKKVAQWRDDLARAAKGKGNYSDDYRSHAKIHEHRRAELIREVKAGHRDPQRLAARQLVRLDRRRRIFDREKGGIFPQNSPPTFAAERRDTPTSRSRGIFECVQIHPFRS
jgi:hypothetical protein